MPRSINTTERHAARQAALQMLYQWEVGGADLGEVIATYPRIRQHALGEEGQRFAETLVRGTAVGLPKIDPLITEHAENWRIERMPVLDRLVLRLAVYELLAGDTPRPVVIDEALELARTFSTEAAVKFINGVLDAIAKQLDGPEA